MRRLPATSAFNATHVGVGLKPRHVERILCTRPPIGLFEIHAENYMGAGGAPHRHLAAIREHHPLSIHGVGLSLGGAEDLDTKHLERLRALVERYEPLLVSEHLAWSSHESGFLSDLLPVPYTRATLERIAEHLDRAQTALRRQILLENPSTYLSFEGNEFAEPEFIGELARRTGCGLLLDVNNVYVTSSNQGLDARAYLSALPLHRVREVHLAGHAARVDRNDKRLLIDSHDRPVAQSVWDLFVEVIGRIGSVPTVIERDANIPTWEELYGEALRAQELMDARQTGAVHALAC